MHFQACVITYIAFALQPLSVLSSSKDEYTAPLSPLYDQDPHDVQDPSLPLPSCAPARDQGIKIRPTIKVIAAFCLSQRGLVSNEFRQPITNSHAFVDTDGSHQSVRLALSWIETGTCPRSKLSISPSQNARSLCRTILSRIMLDCKQHRLSVYQTLNLQQALTIQHYRPEARWSGIAVYGI